MVQRIIILSAVISVLFAGCMSNSRSPKKNGPETTVEAFNRAMATGDFVSAGQMCDTISMKKYIDDYRNEWNMLMKEDSAVLSIASGILSSASIEIIRSEKDGHDHNIFYRIEANGKTKEKQATVRKEEGEWKIIAITDAV